MNFTDLSRESGEQLLFGWKNMFLILWREIFTLLRANLCFLLFCVPVVTIPAALIALQGICIDAIREKECHVFSAFVRTLKNQFVASWSLFLGLGALEFVSVYGAWFYFSRSAQAPGLAVFGLLLCTAAVVGWMMIPYAACMLARVDLTLRQIFKNAFLLVFLNLKFSICCGVVSAALLAAQAVFWLRLLPLLLLCGISLTAYISSYFSLYGLQRFVLTEAL